MKSHLLVSTLFILISNSNTWAQASSFKSSIKELDIRNTHYVGKTLQIIRGQAPQANVHQLVDLNVTDVLIFKNETKNEVQAELKELKQLGIKGHHIPFLWKDIRNHKLACRQMVQAIHLIEKVTGEENGKIFFHCTVGEDRTGILAGVWRLLSEKRPQAENTFQREMCQRGFAEGNPDKPEHVVTQVQENLSPLYMFFAEQIENGLTINDLDESLCNDYNPSEYQNIFQCR
ncbi:MAG: tyrosine-protein phosphatase [Bdellovibrio sp.]|nr:tyrosine-protein phosphatase [Bdellovibrio sp.]